MGLRRGGGSLTGRECWLMLESEINHLISLDEHYLYGVMKGLNG